MKDFKGQIINTLFMTFELWNPKYLSVIKEKAKSKIQNHTQICTEVS